MAQRYGTAFGGTAPHLERVTDVLAAQLAHRSVRSFLPDPLPESVVPTLMAAAQSAASSSNLQLWSVVAVHDPSRRARLADHGCRSRPCCTTSATTRARTSRSPPTTR